ncbi:MAG TPA: TPM domain-containing protein [bacterium]|nr:TPM domain-containing protein [bacterium]
MKKIFLLCLLAHALWSAEYPEKRGAVNDFAGVISAESAAQIEALAIEVFNKTGLAIVVCTMPTIGDADYREYANELYRRWGIGRKGEDRGVLIFNVVDIRKLWLEIGYGAEGFIPDGVAGDIYRHDLVPHLAQGDYSAGFLAAVRSIAGLAAKEYNVAIDGSSAPRPMKREGEASPLCTLLVVLFIILMILSSRGGLLPWLVLSNAGSHTSRRRRDDHWSGWGGGGWGGGFGGGGFGGGGFGGFGGGASGGGGAGGGY